MSQLTDRNQQDARAESDALGTATAARIGAMERKELPTLREAALERWGELFQDGYYTEARQMWFREYEGSK